MQTKKCAGLSLAALILLGLLVSPVAFAADPGLDLVPDARLRVSGVKHEGGNPMDHLRGRAALRDGDLDTAWEPAPDHPAWIEVGISSTGDATGIRLGRAELVWGSGYPETVTLTAGPDRETQQVVARVAVTAPDQLTLTPAVTLDDVRVVFLRFEGRTFSVAQLRLFAADAPALGVLATPRLELRDGHVEIHVTRPEGAHHLEIERLAGPGVDLAWRSTAQSTLDRPSAAVPVRYRARAVDYLGQAGPYSDEVGPVELSPAAEPSPQWRGLVEGFAGPPWSRRTRLDTLRQLGVWGFNAYIYAPKHDPKQRDAWKELYDAEELEHFTELRALGEAVGVRSFFGMSPGMTIDPLSASDLNALVAKYAQLVEQGYRDFVLLMDDGDVRADAVNGANHATLVNRLRSRLLTLEPEASLWFVPSVNSGMPGRFSAEQRAYLNALKTIEADVLIAWTGKGEVDEVVTDEEMEAVSELVGHPLLLWDNYPVNAADRGLYLAPVRGRSASLLRSDKLGGIMVNPMLEGRASWFVLESWARLLADPDSYDPDSLDLDRLGLAYDPACGVETWEGLRRIFSAFRDWQGMNEAPELAEAVDTFVARLSLGAPDDVSEAADLLKDRIFEVTQLADRLDWNCTARGLSDELAVRMDALLALSEAALLSVDLLQADLYGWRQTFYDYEARLERLLSGPLALDYPIADKTLRRLAELARAPGKDRPVKRLVGQARVEAIMAEPLAQARVGQRWYYDAGFMVEPEGVAWRVFADDSLSARVEDHGRVVVNPQNPGRFWLRVDALRDGASVSRVFAVNVVPALHDAGTPSLPMTTELVELEGVPLLLQNGIVVPDVATCQYARMNLAGVWKKRRATVDHRLSFAAREESVLARMEMEACGAHLPDFDDREWGDITLPSVENRMPPLAHPSGPEEFWGGVWYRREVQVPRSGQQIRLVMLAADYIVDVWADGRYLGWHEGGYSPVYLPLPPELADRETLVLTLRVDRPRPGDMPGMLPAQPDVDWWLYAGIVRDIYWEYLPASQVAAIVRASVRPLNMTGQMEVDLVLEELRGAQRPVTVKVEAFHTDGKHPSYWAGASISGAITKAVDVTDSEVRITLEPHQRHALRLRPRILSGSLWEPLYPRIYAVRVRIMDEEKSNLDRYTAQTAFRDVATRDDGTLTFNNKQAFWPGIALQEDSPYAGRALGWSHTLYDLRLAKSRGAMFVRLAAHPHHPNAAIVADRLGLVVMSEIPAWSLDAAEMELQRQRGLARQMWREMVFQNIGRPSVIFWGACVECLPEAGGANLREFILDLRRETDDLFAAGPLVTQAISAAELAQGGDASLEVIDIAGVSVHFSETEMDSEAIGESTKNALTRIREDFPQLPVLLTGFGAESFYDFSGSTGQMRVLDGVWKGVQPLASVTQNRRANVDGFVVAVTWENLADGYAASGGLRTAGLYGMDRQLTKPVAGALRSAYFPYTRGPVLSGGQDLPVRRSGVSECTSPGGSLAPLLWLLLIAGLLLRRVRDEINPTGPE